MINFTAITDNFEETKKLEKRIEELRRATPPSSKYLWCTLNHYEDLRVCGWLGSESPSEGRMFLICVGDDGPFATLMDNNMNAQEYVESNVQEMIDELDEWLRSEK